MTPRLLAGATGCVVGAINRDRRGAGLGMGRGGNWDLGHAAWHLVSVRTPTETRLHIHIVDLQQTSMRQTDARCWGHSSEEESPWLPRT